MVPQLIYFAITMLGLGITMAKHGESRPDYNWLVSLVAVLLGYLLLWWGGFWDPIFVD